MASRTPSTGSRAERDSRIAEGIKNLEKDPENSSQSSSKKPVGIFHPELKSTRMRAYRVWLITSE